MNALNLNLYKIIILVCIISLPFSCRVNDCDVGLTRFLNVSSIIVDDVETRSEYGGLLISFQNGNYYKLHKDSLGDFYVNSGTYEYSDCELTINTDEGEFKYNLSRVGDSHRFESINTPNGQTERITADYWLANPYFVCEDGIQMDEYCLKEDLNAGPKDRWFSWPRSIVVNELGIQNVPQINSMGPDTLPDPFLFIFRSSEDDHSEYLESQHTFISNSNCVTPCFLNSINTFDSAWEYEIHIYDDNSEEGEEPTLIKTIPLDLTEYKDQISSQADLDSLEANGIQLEFEIKLGSTTHRSTIFLSNLEFY